MKLNNILLFTSSFFLIGKSYILKLITCPLNNTNTLFCYNSNYNNTNTLFCYDNNYKNINCFNKTNLFNL